MENKLIEKAIESRLSVMKNTNNKWIIEGTAINGKIWLLQECQRDQWLMRVNEIPQAVIKTETAIEILGNKFFVR